MHETNSLPENNEDNEYLQEIGGILDKILHVLQSNPDIMQKYFPRGCTPAYFISAAGNHIFDDYPEDFNLTKAEGHMIRGWVQSNHVRKDLKTGWRDDADLLEKLIF